MHDLVLKGGRIVDPSQELDAVADIAFAGGKVAQIGKDLKPGKGEVRDVSGRIVAPGLIDLHTHLYDLGTHLGVDPSLVARQGGCTTLIDAGTAGPANFMGFRKHIIEPCPIRILAYLNISFPGIFADTSKPPVGECEDMRLLDPGACVKMAEENRDLIIGIKVRLGRGAGGTNGVKPLDIAIEVASELGLPVMCHLDRMPPARREVLERLRPGDVLTHCFRGFPTAPIDNAGRPRPEVLEARARGVHFDIGHGAGSFAFRSGRGMIENGFYPDSISSDVHCVSINGPAWDMLVTMSKFLCLGMPLAEVIRASTSAPARAVRRPELGTLKPGSPGDATVIELMSGKFHYADVTGETLIGKRRLVSAGLVAGGRWWDDGADSRRALAH